MISGFSYIIYIYKLKFFNFFDIQYNFPEQQSIFGRLIGSNPTFVPNYRQKDRRAEVLSNRVGQEDRRAEVLSNLVEQKDRRPEVLSNLVVQKDRIPEVLSNLVGQKDRRPEVLSNLVGQKDRT